MDRGKTRRRSSSLSGLYDVMEFKRRESGVVCYVRCFLYISGLLANISVFIPRLMAVLT